MLCSCLKCAGRRLPAPDAASKTKSKDKGGEEENDNAQLFLTVLKRHIGLTSAQASAMSRLEVQYFAFKPGEVLVEAGTRWQFMMFVLRGAVSYDKWQSLEIDEVRGPCHYTCQFSPFKQMWSANLAYFTSVFDLSNASPPLFEQWCCCAAYRLAHGPAVLAPFLCRAVSSALLSSSVSRHSATSRRFEPLPRAYWRA